MRLRNVIQVFLVMLWCCSAVPSAAQTGTPGEADVPVGNLERGLIAMWKADASAKDDAGIHHGEMVGGAAYTADRHDHANGAFLFNGASGFVTIPDSPALDTDEAFTLGAWIRPVGYVDSAGYHGIIVSKWCWPNHGDYWLGVSQAGRLRLTVGKGRVSNTAVNYDHLESAAVVPLKKWSHVAATFHRGRMRVYLNGELVGSKDSVKVARTSADEYPFDDLLIGGCVPDCHIFHGAIDDVAVWNRALSAPEVKRLHARGLNENAITDAIGMRLIRIPAGEFLMGYGPEDEGRRHYIGPQRRVRITRPFYIGATEVTGTQYAKVMGTDPSRYRGPDLPAGMVTWENAVAFCWHLTRLERKAGRLGADEEYRLPTEAEWEYAYRAGSPAMYSFGSDPVDLPEYVWFETNAGPRPQPVGRKAPNRWGLYDMGGNVWEWVLDWYRGEYPVGLQVDPRGPASGIQRMVRGGSCDGRADTVRCAFAQGVEPTRTKFKIGFRVVRAAVTP